MRVYIDIETIPDQSRTWQDFADGIDPPSNYKKPETVTKWKTENVEPIATRKWRETALDGSYGQICCICYAIGNDVVTTLSGDEGAMLAGFHESTKFDQVAEWTGHNVAFDLEFIYKRSIIHGMKCYLPWRSAPWQGRYTDTMYLWGGTQKKIKLKELCRILKIDMDDDIDGSEVWDYYQRGEIDKITNHCRTDVERVREIVRLLT